MKEISTLARTCGSCMMCCKLTKIEFFDKPAGRWCTHAKSGFGCSIYNARPNECEKFACEWLLNQGLGSEWQPSVAKFLMFTRETTSDLIILPDPGFPANWKRHPYYSFIKETAARFIEINRLTMVIIGNKLTFILPDRDVTHIASDNDKFVLKKTSSTNGIKYDVVLGH